MFAEDLWRRMREQRMLIIDTELCRNNASFKTVDVKGLN